LKKVNKNRAGFILFLMAALLITENSSLFSAEPVSGRDVAVMLDERPDGDDRKMVMHMVLVNRRGRKRERLMVSLTKDYGKDSKSVFYFRKPADVKGVGFLTWDYDKVSREDDKWLYLPALRKSKRISGSSKNDYFMGSDLTYDDMGDRSVDEDTHRLLGSEKLDGHDCWILESKPKDKSYMYSKVVSRIRKDALIPVKSEFYDRQGKLLKTMTKTEIKKHQGFWVSYRTEVNNVQDRHKTIFEIKEAGFNVGLRNSLFRVTTLERGRLR